jgi:hypothetical protein
MTRFARQGGRLDSPDPVARLMDEDCPQPSLVVELHLVFQLVRLNRTATDQTWPSGAAPDD